MQQKSFSSERSWGWGLGGKGGRGSVGGGGRKAGGRRGGGTRRVQVIHPTTNKDEELFEENWKIKVCVTLFVSSLQVGEGEMDYGFEKIYRLV